MFGLVTAALRPHLYGFGACILFVVPSMVTPCSGLVFAAGTCLTSLELIPDGKRDSHCGAYT